MGQVFSPASGGIAVAPVDRESGPGANGGASGNRCIFLGQGAGTNSPLSDNIVLGNAAENGNAADNAGDGTIVIGSQAVQAANVIYDRSAAESTAIGPALIIGTNAAQACNMLPNTMVIGNNALKGMVNTISNDSVWNNTIIGNRAVELPTGNGNFFTENVIIGSRAARSASSTIAGWIQNTLIGSRVAEGLGNAGGSDVSNNVIIGYKAAFNYRGGNVQNNVLIGSLACQNGLLGKQNVCIGQGSDVGNGQDNVIVGASAQTFGSNNVQLGSGTSSGIQTTGIGWILVGYNAGSGENSSDSYKLVLESYISAQHTCYVYGSGQESGGVRTNIVLGNSTPGADRAFGAAQSNCVKLLNGVAGGTPASGGYFYVNAGALHWVGSGGTDTTVAPA